MSSDDLLKKLVEAGPPRRKMRTPKRRKKKTDTHVDLTRLHELSETELVAIAQMAGYENASRQLLREDLISIIMGDADNPLDPLESVREKIFAFVDSNKSVMASMMPCDLHCPTCPHHMVVECFTTNRDIVESE